jgi:hypothetical protein
MVAGDDWLENLAISPNNTRQKSDARTLNLRVIEKALIRDKFRQKHDFMRYYNKPLPNQ